MRIHSLGYILVSDPETHSGAELFTRPPGFETITSFSIWSVWTPPAYRGKGGARRVMLEVCDILDEEGVRGHLKASPFTRDLEPGPAMRDLVRFYSSFGFEPIGPINDYLVPMTRPVRAVMRPQMLETCDARI